MSLTSTTFDTEAHVESWWWRRPGEGDGATVGIPDIISGLGGRCHVALAPNILSGWLLWYLAVP